ncbi:flagellar hook-length control protein FliK [Halioxenophilus sp. WMMB6]|uniref:flagellar hook-length control protein FliK n=1 Tax=Halioxenophilus sp. WMMB6 TaxID=3073815 RepID=UPI00295E8B8A|nr:flagellar hook-length control protein FliK [Halioxenophilus sp. WMMB6]
MTSTNLLLPTNSSTNIPASSSSSPLTVKGAKIASVGDAPLANEAAAGEQFAQYFEQAVGQPDSAPPLGPATLSGLQMHSQLKLMADSEPGTEDQAEILPEAALISVLFAASDVKPAPTGGEVGVDLTNVAPSAELPEQALLVPLATADVDAAAALSTTSTTSAGQVTTDPAAIGVLTPLTDEQSVTRPSGLQLGSQWQTSAQAVPATAATAPAAVAQEQPSSLQPMTAGVLGDSAAKSLPGAENLNLPSFDKLLDVAVTASNNAGADTSSPVPDGPVPANPLSALESRLSVSTLNQLATTQTVGAAGWGDEVAEKVLWMASQGLSEAEIHLDPPELGPLRAHVTIHNDQAQVVFNSHSAQVRDALDQSAARLREMFAGEGLNLVDVGVSDHSFAENSDQPQHEESDAPAAEVVSLEATPLQTSKAISQYLVDQYV